MSDIPSANNLSNSDEEAVVDVFKSSVDNINYISSDSASTFEYVDEKLYHQQKTTERDNFSPIETIDYEDVVAPMPLASTKEEKQRHNEEIAVMDSVAASHSSNSWEPTPKTNDDLKEKCLLFLRSERNLNEHSTPSKSKPCFIDASSLLDEEDLIYTPPPSVAHRPYNVNVHNLERSFAAEDKDDTLSHPMTTNYDIKDQYAALDKTPITRSPNVYSPVRMFRESGSGSRESEKLQGNMIFQNSIQHYSGHVIKQHHHDDVYTSDMSSIQSAYSSASGGDVGHRGEYSTLNSHYNSLVENTSDYNSSFSRTQSDNDSSIVLPDTPFNSIVQVASQQLKIYEENDLLDGQASAESRPPTTNPIKIPKRAMKYDEFAPVLSGGASVKDFTPKQCESPILRRKTDTCPIVSGGSVIADVIESGEEKSSTPRAATRRSSTSSHSWVVDFNELKIKENEDDDNFAEAIAAKSKKKGDLSSGAKSLDYSSSNNNSLGFYVDFGSLKENSAESSGEEKIKKEPPRPAPRQKPTGFYVDLSESPAATKDDKSTVAVSDVNSQKPASAAPQTSTNNVEKKNMFSMFIDFNDDVGVAGSDVNNKKSAVAVASSASSDEKSPPQSAGGNNDVKNEKKSCYMFIESDSPVVRRRQMATAMNDSSKRHSWNVNQQDEPTEAQRAAKTYQRSTSVSNEKGVMNILDKIPSLLSKTSSMSIDSSVSPYEDFSCSKSFSSYSNNSGTSNSSNSSIDHSGTKVQVEGAAEVMTASAKKRRKDAKINETFDKSSQGSITEGILSHDDSHGSSTDTDDVTFQNQETNGEDDNKLEIKRDTSTSDFKATKMETIPEISENSPRKKVSVEAAAASKKTIETMAKLEERDEDFKIETHTMESLQALIEKQKQILENNVDSPSTSISFVKLSDLDKPIKQNIYETSTTSSTINNNNASSMSNSAKVSRMFQQDSTAGHRSLTLQNESKTNHNWNMSRSTGNNSLSTLASSVENFRSLTRLFPHLTDVISTSVPNNVSMNSFDQSFIDRLEFISSDFSCTSSVTSSRSGMDSADESSMSCRQPKRLGEDLLKMFIQELGTDVTIEVGNRKMKAHKCILRSRCQYFAAILAGNWVSHTGNVISLHGYSYSAVHFALCHIYSGASHPPEGISLMELAALSDLLGLEGLKEVTTYALKTNYCHNFHKPCSGCIDGITQVLPVTLNHGLDDLYRKCLKWVCKNFNKVWMTKQFAACNSDIHNRCRQQIAAHFTSENVLHWIVECEDMLKNLENCRWDVIEVDNLIRDILDSAHGYIMDHFASLIASDSFLSLGHGEKSTIARLENLLLRTAAGLSADQACRSYPRAVRLNQLLTAKVILPNPLSNESLQTMDRVSTKIQLRDEDLGWHEDFVCLVSALMTAIEQNLIRQCSKAMRCSSWQRMDADLRSKMQKLACLTDTDDLRKLRSSASSTASVRNYSVSSSISSRSNDLRQVKLAIQAHNRKIHGGYENSNIPVIKRAAPVSNVNTNYPVTKASTRTNIPEKIPSHKRSHSEETSISSRSGKFVGVKSRYMEPPKPKTPLLDNRASNRLRVKVMSSSESSTRGSSPAFNRRQAVQQVKKASNLSLDSLQSPMKTKPTIANKKVDNSEISIDSLVESMKTSIKTYSNESLVKKSGRNLTDETKLKKMTNGESKKKGISATTTVNGRLAVKSVTASKTQNTQVRTTFLSQKSREILARRERKHSTNSTSSLATTKSNDTTSPRMNEINKSSSSASILSRKKVYSTTLHLRKTATLSDASESSRRDRDFSSKSQNSFSTNSNAKTSKTAPSTAAMTKASASATKKPKTNVNKVDNKDKRSTKSNNKQQQHAPLAHPDDEDEEIITAKMARSNTFSKEKSDNPLELLKIMN